jgi:signal transduction histidine kinase
VQALKGRFSVEGRPGAGVRVQAVIPLPVQAAVAAG